MPHFIWYSRGMKNLLQKLLVKLVNKLCKYLEKNGGRYLIPDRGAGGVDKGRTYLVRYILFKSKWMCIYIHRFLVSDLETFHDHPWNFFTFVIQGGYDEYKIKRKNGLWIEKRIRRKPMSLAYRKATDIHRVAVDRNYTEEEMESAPLTICVIGPRVREWGFWIGDKVKKWIGWTDFLNIDTSNSDFRGHE